MSMKRSWTPQKKKETREALQRQYMSSDEDGEDGQFIAISVTWRSKEFKKRIAELDEKYRVTADFICGISLTSGQLVTELFPDCTRSCFSQVVLRRRGGDRIYEMGCLFVAVRPNAPFIVLPHWDNMS